MLQYYAGRTSKPVIAVVCRATSVKAAVAYAKAHLTLARLGVASANPSTTTPSSPTGTSAAISDEATELYSGEDGALAIAAITAAVAAAAHKAVVVTPHELEEEDEATSVEQQLEQMSIHSSDRAHHGHATEPRHIDEEHSTNAHTEQVVAHAGQSTEDQPSAIEPLVIVEELDAVQPPAKEENMGVGEGAAVNEENDERDGEDAMPREANDVQYSGHAATTLSADCLHPTTAITVQAIDEIVLNDAAESALVLDEANLDENIDAVEGGGGDGGGGEDDD